ncbi:MAG: zinc-binding dehydrogenase [Betaproteobacteria bacterium]|nr:zinc-binding dehydrogenase [Betaproteobacteria bacterium]
MDNAIASQGLQLRSLIRRSGELELSVVALETPLPQADEVVVRVEATPINPSDVGLLFGAADMSTATASGTAAKPIVTARIPEGRIESMAGRLDQSLPVGNEGTGVVIAAGSSSAAQALLGRAVALFGGAMYSQYRCVKVEQCLVLPEGTAPADAASCFVNPLTALGMVETMRREGHSALVHTAAASNLGQMLNRICIAENIGLVNVVRTQEQQHLLKAMGARHVCNTGSPTFIQDLTEAIIATGATLAFDAIGGGALAGQILTCMEAALTRSATEYSRYGSATHKQLYIYGALDLTPTVLSRNFGFAWSIGGWLLWPFLQRIGPAAAEKLRQRIVAELKTTFASHYTKVISLAEALSLEEIAAYSKRATGAKYLIDPNKGITA